MTSLVWQVNIVQTVLYLTAKAILPRLTSCVFSKAEHWGRILWSTRYKYATHETTEAWRCSPRFSGRDYDTKWRRYADDKLSKKYPPPSIWRLLKEHNLSSCKFSGRSARGICPVTKIHIFLYRNSHVGGGGQSSHAILLTCNAATYFSRYSLTAKILDFGEWGFLGGTTPKGETCLGRYVTSCKISRRSVSPSPRYLFPHK